MTDKNTEQMIKEHQDKCNLFREKLKAEKILGPWIDEPDRMEFKAHGLNCLLKRVPTFFHWCGYVGVSQDHPFYGKDYDDVRVEVHGGLTYGEKCQLAVCHIAEGEDDLFWFGFDCVHYGDITPYQTYYDTLNAFAKPPLDRHIYRDIDYVMDQTTKLAKQLAKLG